MSLNFIKRLYQNKFFLALIILIISLWQLESVYWVMYLHQPYCFPFSVYCSYQYWNIRDFYYSLIVFAFFLAGLRFKA